MAALLPVQIARNLKLLARHDLGGFPNTGEGLAVIRPEEIAAFLPETPAGQRGCGISDVFVDDRRIIYAADRAMGGLYLLEYTGKRPLG